PRASRLPLANPGPGHSKAVARAEKSEAKMRREVQANRKIAGNWKRTARFTKLPKASRVAGSSCTTRPRKRNSELRKAASKEPANLAPSEMTKMNSGSRESSV